MAFFQSSSQAACPFCFETFKLDDVRFRCINPRCSGQEADSIFAEARSRPAVQMGRVFAPNGKGGWGGRKPLTKDRCGTCGKETQKRVCPSCHFELSHDLGLVEDKIIAIIGGRETGKSHYIATLINRLEHEVGGNFSFSVRMLGDETRTRFEQDFYSPLFRRKSLIAATASAQAEMATRLPMIFRLTFAKGGGNRAVNLSFFDSAGEDMRDVDVLSVHARYITSAAGIIFLLDPLQIDAVRQLLPGANLPTPDPLSEPAYIVERLRELFERRYTLGPTDKVKVPVAFSLSKLDALLPILDPGTILHRPGEHFGHLDLREIESVHTEIWSYLETWMGSGFSSRVNDGFARFRYFALSSLGQTPDGQRHVESINPLRVEDPFLWLLHEIGVVKGKKDG